jgi:hypothetical protein
MCLFLRIFQTNFQIGNLYVRGKHVIFTFIGIFFGISDCILNNLKIREVDMARPTN